MQGFRNVLFPVDMSDNCTTAVPFVEAMVRKLEANLTLLHVLEMPPAYFTDWCGYMSMVDTQGIINSRQNEFDSYLRDRFSGLHVDRVMFEGDPAQAIIKFTQEQATDLIMMPTYGYGVFRHLLLGSVTAKVLHEALCPVWTGVHIENTPAVSTSIERIMCAVDLTKSSVATMRFADQFAKEFNAKLWLVHAVPGPEVGPEKYFDSDFQIFLEAEARKTIAKMQQEERIDAQLCLGTGDVANVVQQAALHHEANLVVIGRGHATRLLGPLRTNVHAVIRKSPCPVISV